jgi:serine/threonine protein kinase/tetratricopeptide (TPR) repeat protein
MPPPTNADELLALLQRSELVAAERLRELEPPPPAATPKQLAAQLVASGLLTRFQAEQLLLGKYRGFTLGKYRVLERIGHGGNGTVYLCEHQIVRRKVAIKVLPTNRADSPAALTRFYREARAAGALDHPNLVKAHDVDEENGLHFLVMDFVDGTNLQDLVTRNSPLDPVRAAHYVAQAARGLEAAHAAGLVHRDVKPGNLLLDRHGVIRVSDLGLARFQCDDDENNPLTLRFDDKTVLGTADYVAPEQALNSHEVDGRADIYSLGATFYFLLTGQPPFPEGKAAKKLMAHQIQEPVPVGQLRPEVPAEMAAVVARMMAKRPQERYQSPAEVVAALQAWTATPVAPPLPEEMPQLSPAVRVPASPSPDPSSAALLRNSGQRSSGVRGSARSGRTIHDSSAGPASNGRSGPRTGPRPGPRSGSSSSGALGHTMRRTAADTRTRSDYTPSGSHRKTHLDTRAVKAPPVTGQYRRRGGTGAWAAWLRSPWGRRVVIFVVVGIVAGLALRWALRKPAAATTTTSAPDATGRAPTLVVRPGGGDGAYSSIGAALRQARPGSRILVEADDWAEALDLAADVPPVRIEGHNAIDAVRWRAPVGHPAGKPLVHITGRPGLTLTGVDLDGGGQVEDLVRAEGSCANVVLENVSLTGFRRTGITFRNCQAQGGGPVVVRHVRVFTDHKAPAALAFEAAPGSANRDVLVHECRLEGPYSAAVVVDGAVGGLVFTDNRIFNVTDGLLFRKAVPANPLGLMMARNTLCNVGGTGLHFEVPPAPAGSQVTVANNLFARTATLARVDGVSSAPAAWLTPGPSGNVCDPASREGFPQLGVRAVAFELPADPQDDGHFLRYGRTSVLARTGAPGVAPPPETLPTDPLERGRILAGRKDWGRAADAYAEALKAHSPEDGHFWFEYAAVLCLAGKRAEYHAACLHMLDSNSRSLRTYHAARACTLSADFPGDLPRAAEKSAAELSRSRHEDWSLMQQGALEYRAGQVEAAIPFFERSIQVGPRPGGAVLCWLWLALCNQRLGKVEEARAWLDKAVEFLDKHDGVGPNADPSINLHLHNWIEAFVLRREAESLIGRQTPARKP